MADRHFPVRPNLKQLKHQAKELLRALKNAEITALETLKKYHPGKILPRQAKLADAQLTLARSYGLTSWPRLVLACRMIHAIWEDDKKTVRNLIKKHPKLLQENARGVKGNWGPPMSYAANLGRKQMIVMLKGLGATDIKLAFDRACLQGKLDTARTLYHMGAKPAPGAVMGPAETQSGTGMDLLLEMGATICDDNGNQLAPIAMVLETYCRNPKGKHQCLELFAKYGIDLPDTPTLALHRGRLDLLAKHLRRDPTLLARTFSHQEIYPPELGCHADESLALHGTPLASTTLLHLCIDYDEFEIARWLIDQGVDVNGKGALDKEGFGGHTPLFGCVVSQTYRVGLRKDDSFARLLLEHGANPKIRASLRKQLRFVKDESMHEYHDVDPLLWGKQFHDQSWVNRSVMKLLGTNL